MYDGFALDGVIILFVGAYSTRVDEGRGEAASDVEIGGRWVVKGSVYLGLYLFEVNGCS